jgi:hypothetical protein
MVIGFIGHACACAPGDTAPRHATKAVITSKEYRNSAPDFLDGQGKFMKGSDRGWSEFADGHFVQLADNRFETLTDGVEALVSEARPWAMAGDRD